jgi:hypothetical protein
MIHVRRVGEVMLARSTVTKTVGSNVDDVGLFRSLSIASVCCSCSRASVDFVRNHSRVPEQAGGMRGSGYGKMEEV